MHARSLLLLALPVLLALQCACTCRTCGDPAPIVRLGVVIPPTLKPLEGVYPDRYVSAGGSRDFTLMWSGTPLPFPPGAFPQWSALHGTVDRTGHYQAPATLGVDTISVLLPNGWEMEWTLEVIPAPAIQTFTVSPTPVPSGSPVTFQVTYSGRAQARLLKGETVLTSSSNGALSFTHVPAASGTYTLQVMNLAGDVVREDRQVTVQ